MRVGTDRVRKTLPTNAHGRAVPRRIELVERGVKSGEHAVGVLVVNPRVERVLTRVHHKHVDVPLGRGAVVVPVGFECVAFFEAGLGGRKHVLVVAELNPVRRVEKLRPTGLALVVLAVPVAEHVLCLVVDMPPLVFSDREVAVSILIVEQIGLHVGRNEVLDTSEFAVEVVGERRRSHEIRALLGRPLCPIGISDGTIPTLLDRR